MLDELRRIVTEVAQSVDLRTALDLIARRVRDALNVDVCSVYVLTRAVPAQEAGLLLQATEGLNKTMIGRVTLALNEGLVGLVARRAELVNLENAPDHPAFKFVSDIGEEFYHGFLGVPIIYRGDVLGVLVVQSIERRKFSSDQESFLVTLASQLASGIRQAQVSGELSQHEAPAADLGAAVVARGLPGSPGIVFGTAVSVLNSVDLESVADRVVEDPALEWQALLSAIDAVRSEFAQLKADFARAAGNTDENILFDAFIMMLGSSTFIGSMESRVQAGMSASAALRDTVREHAAVFEHMSDPYLRERAQDVRDLGTRILVKLRARTQDAQDLPERIVLIGRDLSASHLAEIPTDRLVGIVSSSGTGSSHLAILARALGIPAAMGVSDLPIVSLNGQEVVVDGYRGLLIVRPVGSFRQELSRLAQEEAQLTAGLKALCDLPAQSLDGFRIGMYVNIGLLADMAPSMTVGAEGIGLYRTEIPFQIRKQFPGEEEQAAIYREALETFRGKEVVLRTLDVGGDKPLSYFPIKEDNPFLGWRGIRLVLDHPEIFLTQIRAMLRASIGLDNLSILLPMIGSVEELETAKEYIFQALNELREEGEDISTPRIGVMIEVPSAVYQIETIAAMVDFLSIGTNDLTQYILAIDRNNERVAARYDALHPAVLRAIVEVIDASHLLGREVTVCGELSGDPMGAVLLLGMGIDVLSMSAGSLPRIKWVIQSFKQSDARQLLTAALECSRPTQIRAMLSQALEERGLGGLIRAGS
ncbi:MAG: phosphoenolpyruvate--protein phosphotransferase [Halothiobacillus sp. 14-56-357]|jgi:phosphotransferase system enzyme I (PtsP)|uniref:phosphoenolpyruvate--protein phosphotransferase n=1 Tax=Halothiobacillus sp. 15-55-196 TaxID=1970382 RepID=UPI000BD6DBF3|nr:phosphoenolpyruvate--protein phosphotransferase [Halothiobacillus sp. 15-55-196]OZB37604.1 MAG: phosphoenolpyruvate--protein phosphotransferase [Halothiobacillus sp. 15-55-196]OZB57148.1 MAG: phosphoenolpyruvate--protein phosphotransferase [Halothiobacillus sp. 14-56-357]OZB78168.1 MAG: phosphoenolpyruvate--protein phosphotransferase [Halothiobacillus sp. 13-55-115]